ncbi:MAG: capsular biosynthesis protein [Clostridia bacterium]|nr:capsular biosynthesis protein [Clostridia bacterium]
MLDLHTHILPAIDDGAVDTEMSLEMLRKEREHGVKRIYLTPHFDPYAMDVDTFLELRQKSFDTLKNALGEEEWPEMRLGAEVKYSPELLDMSPEKLTLGGSDYLLLELSFHHYPAHLDQVVGELDGMGITPILAHVERYSYFRKESALLVNAINNGALAQINVEPLTDKNDKGFASACIDHSLAHFIGTDAHNLTSRAPNMNELGSHVSEIQLSRLKKFSDMLWENEAPPHIRPTLVQKGLFRYK